MRVVKLNQIWSQNRWTLMRPQENNWKKHPVKSEDLWWGRRKIIEKNTLWNLRIRGCAVVWTKKSLMRCTSNLFRETVPLWDCSGEERFLSVLCLVRGQIIGVGVGLKLAFLSGGLMLASRWSLSRASRLHVWSVLVEQLPDCVFDQLQWNSFLIVRLINDCGTASWLHVLSITVEQFPNCMFVEQYIQLWVQGKEVLGLGDSSL